ncbi:MAG: helix-turn-helix domain-containing protein [Rhodopila sp.]|nr:helix-turn-helix domain-containing protein [Rhodopila sp.]
MLTTLQATDPGSRLAIGAVAAGVTQMPPKADVLGSLKPLAAIVRFDRDEEIVAQGGKAAYCYLVVSGCVRTVRLSEDGRRQVGEFVFPGELFGWEALDAHDFGAEAVTPVTLHRFARLDFDGLADRDHGFARRLRELTGIQVRAGRDRMFRLGRMSACERVASFLLEMTERMNLVDRPSIELPMCRTDMADYLGLTIETVCRELTQLRRDGTIAVERTKVTILDRRALAAAGCRRVIH